MKNAIVLFTLAMLLNPVTAILAQDGPQFGFGRTGNDLRFGLNCFDDQFFMNGAPGSLNRVPMFLDPSQIDGGCSTVSTDIGQFLQVLANNNPNLVPSNGFGGLSPLQRGSNEQVVDPAVAVRKWGVVSGGTAWEKRVNASIQGVDGQGSANQCSIAINALFDQVCGNNHSCDIEARYESHCVTRNSGDEQHAKTCIALVDSYVATCFGNLCPVNFGVLSGITLPGARVSRGDNVFCSAALASLNDGDGTVGLTVEHCDVQSGEVLSGSGLRDNVSSVSTSSLDSNGRVEVLELSNGVFGTGQPMPIGSPVLFAETFFLGFNALVDMRNQVAATVSPPLGEKSTLMCDSSDLCTIVADLGNGDLLHTCQSTRGGSGGGLFQKIAPDSHNFVLVGLNRGAAHSGVVSENQGISLSAQN